MVLLRLTDEGAVKLYAFLDTAAYALSSQYTAEIHNIRKQLHKEIFQLKEGMDATEQGE